MIDKKPFRVTNEQVERDMTTVLYEDYASDLFVARELIDNQEAIIKEMREELREVLMTREYSSPKEMVFITNFTEIERLLEKTKDYA